MSSLKTFKQATKAGKPKTRKWDSQHRFSGGHDLACLALLPESEKFKHCSVKKQRPKVGVYRSPSFGMTRVERIARDILFYLNSGMASTEEEARVLAEDNWGKLDDSE